MNNRQLIAFLNEFLAEKTKEWQTEIDFEKIQNNFKDLQNFLNFAFDLDKLFKLRFLEAEIKFFMENEDFEYDWIIEVLDEEILDFNNLINKKSNATELLYNLKRNVLQNLKTRLEMQYWILQEKANENQ